METPVSSIVSTGDLGGQKVKMTFDENSLAHLMSVLTDLYSDPQLAVIREYSTNALDSHIEAGNPAPIEITTPNNMSPFFVVKDYGIGLSIDDITDMYSKYGASSKRGTNEQVGMLGLGAKSALTLVPQFTLTSVKNGVKIWVSISRASDGSGQMEIIDTAATDEPNGVEIKIPVPRNHDFAAKCENFFRFWKPGTVLLNGKEPVQIEGRPVGESFIVVNELRQDYIVMGNVAYPCKENLAGGYSYNQLGVVAFVEIGDVNFTPSREQLHYTTKTRDTISSLQKEFSARLTDSINKDLADSKSFGEAWERAREWRASFYNVRGLKYQGADIPTEVETADGKVFYIVGRNGRYASWLRGVTPNLAKTHIFVTGFADSLKISPVQREKVAKWAELNGKSFDKVVLTKEDSFQTDPNLTRWLTDFTIVDWKSDIAPIKVERNNKANKVIRTDPYDLFDGSWKGKQVASLDTSKPIVYYSTAELRHPSWLPGLLDKDTQIVMLGRNRWEKFNRDYPTGKHYLKAISDRQDALVTKLTTSDRILWHYSGYKYTVRHLDCNRIDDPTLHEFVEVLSGPGKFSDAAILLREQIRRDIPQPEVEVPDNPLTKYPLLANMRETDAEHLYWYLNSYYAHLTSKEN